MHMKHRHTTNHLPTSGLTFHTMSTKLEYIYKQSIYIQKTYCVVCVAAGDHTLFRMYGITHTTQTVSVYTTQTIFVYKQSICISFFMFKDLYTRNNYLNFSFIISRVTRELNSLQVSSFNVGCPLQQDHRERKNAMERNFDKQVKMMTHRLVIFYSLGAVADMMRHSS